MTPPDPATPSPLEALLSHVDEWAGDPKAPRYLATDAAPRLAAIVRVLRDAMTEADVDLDPRYPLPRKARKRLDTALRRADEIAEGK